MFGRFQDGPAWAIPAWAADLFDPDQLDGDGHTAFLDLIDAVAQA